MENNKSNILHNAICSNCFKGKLVAVRNITANPPLKTGKKTHGCVKENKAQSQNG